MVDVVDVGGDVKVEVEDVVGCSLRRREGVYAEFDEVHNLFNEEGAVFGPLRIESRGNGLLGAARAWPRTLWDGVGKPLPRTWVLPPIPHRLLVL